MYTNPLDMDSPQFEMTAPVFKTRTPDKTIKEVIQGLNLTNGPKSVPPAGMLYFAG